MMFRKPSVFHLDPKTPGFGVQGFRVLGFGVVGFRV